MMKEDSIWLSQKQSRTFHQPRLRREYYGELIQIDGSDHRWFEDRGLTCSLLVFIDDATSILMEPRFVTSERTFGHAMTQPNIKILCANSSQATGRVERSNKTLQDRLVKELRRAVISSMEEGNPFLWGVSSATLRASPKLLPSRITCIAR